MWTNIFRWYNAAKERLAWEITAVIHGKEEADKAREGAKAAFGGGGDKNSMPTAEISRSLISNGIGVIDLYAEVKLGGSKSDIRRLIEQGGAYYTDKNGTETVFSDVKTVVDENFLDKDGELILRAGKKKFMRVVCK